MILLVDMFDFHGSIVPDMVVRAVVYIWRAVPFRFQCWPRMRMGSVVFVSHCHIEASFFFFADFFFNFPSISAWFQEMIGDLPVILVCLHMTLHSQHTHTHTHTGGSNSLWCGCAISLSTAAPPLLRCSR